MVYEYLNESLNLVLVYC